MAACTRILTLVVLFLPVLPRPAALAQSEVERERLSLRGIDRFYLALTVEGPRSVVDRDVLDVRTLDPAIRTRLQEAGLTVLKETPEPPDARVPALHVHVNAMEADRGQIPFAVEVRFYQTVLLARDPSQATVAATWEASLVGLTYPGQWALIADAAHALVDDFVEDFRVVNP